MYVQKKRSGRRAGPGADRPGAASRRDWAWTRFSASNDGRHNGNKGFLSFWCSFRDPPILGNPGLRMIEFNIYWYLGTFFLYVQKKGSYKTKVAREPKFYMDFAGNTRDYKGLGGFHGHFGPPPASRRAAQDAFPIKIWSPI